jgi:NTP pyrophosphatase (non-canonical NTP hydrolase)
MTDLGRVVADVNNEVIRATDMFPDWPLDARHACMIVAEECGELVCAVNDRDADTGKREQSSDVHVYTEAIQTAAMAIRFAVNELARRK